MPLPNPSPNLFDDPNRASRPTYNYSDPLPMTLEEMKERGWEQVDVVFITGDAYVDSPSFANGLLARLLEADGFSVAVLSQPDWHSVDDFRKLGRPKLAFCVSAGNMDSMLNHYTANRKVRNDDAYTAGGKIGRRPDRATLSYCQRAREAFPGVPILTGGIEASLRRIAHYDYWSDRVRCSILHSAKADLLLYGMGERPLLEVMRRLSAGEDVRSIRDVRGTVYPLGRTEDLLEESDTVAHLPSFEEVTGTDLLPTQALKINGLKEELDEINKTLANDKKTHELDDQTRASLLRQTEGIERKIERIRVENVRLSKRNFVKMTQIAFENLNPYSAKTLLQECAEEAIVVNPPAYPLSEEEMDAVYALPFTRKAHPSYTEPIPAVEIVSSTVQTHRGCFGGCTFCAITAHQGKFIQNRSENAIVSEIKNLVESPDGNRVISDLNAPTANMYRLGGKNFEICKQCRKISCLCPEICPNLDVDQTPYVELLRKVRTVEGVKQAFIASGVRTDLAVLCPSFVAELAAHHTGGHLKTAPEHVDNNVLRLMNKPPIENHEEFCNLFEEESRKAGKEQYTVPYLISGFPGSTIKSMVDVAVYLKKHDLRPEQVQDFIPAPFQLATCTYYTGIDPVTEEQVYVPKRLRERRLQRALLLYYNPAFYRDVKSALKEAGREDLIGNGPDCLIPPYLPKPYTMGRSSRIKYLKRRTERENEAKRKRREEYRSLEQNERRPSDKGKRRGRTGGGTGGYRSSAKAYGRGGERSFKSARSNKPFGDRNRGFDLEGDAGSADNKGKFRRRDRSEDGEFQRSDGGFRSKKYSKFGGKGKTRGGKFSDASKGKRDSKQWNKNDSRRSPKTNGGARKGSGNSDSKDE